MGSPQKIHDALPPFLSQNAPEINKIESPKEVKLINLDPIHLKFYLGDMVTSKATLNISNLTQNRVAWRLRSNAPNRYVVNPACGFLTGSETVTLSIELTNTNKYSNRHKFIVQALEAKDEDKDRRKIWCSERAQNLDFVQSCRVYTVAAGPNSINLASSRQAVLISSSHPAIQASTQAVTQVSNQPVSLTPSQAPCQPSAQPLAQPPVQPPAHPVAQPVAEPVVEVCGNMDEKIAKLTEQAKVFFEQKEKAAKRLHDTINEVKKVEVELDRVGVQCKELNAQVNTITAQITALEERSAELDFQIKAMTIKP